jgi:hypothetical protein
MSRRLDADEQHDGHGGEREGDDVGLGLLPLLDGGEDEQGGGLGLAAPISPMERAIVRATP